MFDVCIMREQFSNRIEQFGRNIILIKYENIQGKEYFHDHEDEQIETNTIKAIVITTDSDKYDHKPEGAVRTIRLLATVKWDVDVSNEDFVKDNGVFYKVVGLDKTRDPLSNSVIGQVFELQKINLYEEEDD